MQIHEQNPGRLRPAITAFSDIVVRKGFGDIVAIVAEKKAVEAGGPKREVTFQAKVQHIDELGRKSCNGCGGIQVEVDVGESTCRRETAVYQCYARGFGARESDLSESFYISCESY
ncbi:hypothetical protein SNOG_02083 [Parastagonospora nodorum SN15]|uniref:Uncharacterized protein n=1 Tax=Phaeosphaeria nodorum (strain SN15 / ATCC MYA-4574 / FGSC 10173) TaxID=321614 RepID=Q0V1N1_PHANO|nr:hypothetical protein SNOG_02083 [Parastagonospora nodorum SN15]EAT90295.1 hypothetical protein SNOG_02083 [Parastagonospora nodorum SN15]